MITDLFTYVSLFKIQDTKQVREFAKKLLIRMSLLLFMRLLLGCFILRVEGTSFDNNIYYNFVQFKEYF